MYFQYSDKIHWIGIGLNIHIKASFLTNVIVRFSVCPLFVTVQSVMVGRRPNFEWHINSSC